MSELRPRRPPLVALLDEATGLFVREFDRRLAQSEFTSLSLAHAKNVLRFLADGPARASQIVGRCGVTKQAVSQQIVHLQRNGYLLVSVDPVDHRARLLTLTSRGERAQAHVRRLFVEIERDWARRLGRERVGDLRDLLGQILERPPGTGS